MVDTATKPRPARSAEPHTECDARPNIAWQERAPSLTVFFPCYNEQGNVERVTAAALSACRSITADFEVLIVNDGSVDRTGEIAERLAARHAEVRVIHNDGNAGYGGALQRGFRAATKQWIFYTDGDGQFDLRELPRIWALRDRYDIVSAYRLNRQDPLLRRLNGWLWNALIRRLFGLHVKDIDCAFKLFPRSLFDSIEILATGALIDAEILAKAHRLGYRIGQVGVHHYPRRTGRQTGAKLSVIVRAFAELATLGRHIRRFPRHGSIPAPLADRALQHP